MRRDWYTDMVSFSAMVSLECTNVGLNTLYKAATLKGLNYHVFVVYAYGIAALILLPSPFITHRFLFLPQIFASFLIFHKSPNNI